MMSRYISIELVALVVIGLTQVICSQSLMINRANDMDLAASSKLESFDSDPSSYEPSSEAARTSDDVIDELQEGKLVSIYKPKPA